MVFDNLKPVNITYEGKVYPCAYSAYLAAKTSNMMLRQMCAETTSVKRLEEIKALIPTEKDWLEKRESVLYRILKERFINDNVSRKALLDAENLVYYSPNIYWGVNHVTGVGKNTLGRLLKVLKQELQQ